MKAVESSRRRLPPSKLAAKILCKGYDPSEFPKGGDGERLRWKHSDEMVSVIKHLLATKYLMLDVEVHVNGGRIDLLAQAPDGRRIGFEVKSHQGEIREIDKIQAALYWTPQFDGVAVANRRTILLLTSDYVKKVRAAGNVTQEFLEKQPDLALASYTPHADVCRSCRNQHCPHLQPFFSIRRTSAG